MKNDHQYYLNMCLKVKKFYRTHEDKLDSISGMPRMMNRLLLLTETLDLEFENSVSYYNGYSIERARKREELQKECWKFSQIYIDIQEAIKYKPIQQLKHMVHLSMPEMNALDENELIHYASGLIELIPLLESRLKLQGIHQKAIEKFSQSLTMFALDYPMNQFSENKRKTSHLLTLKALDDLNNFYSEVLDPAIRELSINDSSLFSEYLRSRQLVSIEMSRPPDFEGELNDEAVALITEIKYEHDREILVNVIGGNAIWGFSNHLKKIDYSRPVAENENLCLKSRVVAPDGKYLMMQAVSRDSPIKYKIWIID